jgi:ATP-dependent Clp protease protease subunit
MKIEKDPNIDPKTQNTLANLYTAKYLETYVKLSKDRVIFLSEIFTKETSSAISALLLNYDHENTENDVSIYIHSSGGDGASLTNIYDVMQMISAPVKTVCIGKCYSAGAILLASGTKGKRFIFKHGRVMIHGLQCAFPLATDTDQVGSDNYYNFLNKYNHRILSLLAKHTGQPIDKIKKDCERDMYFDAKGALAYGLVDHII